MKKYPIIIIIFLILVLLALVIDSIYTTINSDDNNINASPDAEGYAIIHHWDGDEHVDFSSYRISDGCIFIHATDGRTILSNNATLIFY